MEEVESPARLNAVLSKYYKTRTEYNSVTVLVIYWQECSTSGFKEEGAKIGCLFSADFSYNVEYFEIPSIDSQLALDVNKLLIENRRDDTLLIIHYGGHGDDDDEHKRQSVWAA
jgi:ribulose bisphosphate carboxylase small subunit